MSILTMLVGVSIGLALIYITVLNLVMHAGRNKRRANMSIIISKKGLSTCGLSADGKYRYFLTRQWVYRKKVRDTVLWIMLNPSTADHNVDDPTIRRCMGFSRSWGYKAITVCNLWPFRATSPAWLWSHSFENILGSDGVNDSYILEHAEKSALIICAWGIHGQKYEQGERVKQLLLDAGHDLFAL